MHNVDVDWEDLELAFRDPTGNECFLDRQSGAVACVLHGFPDEKDLRQKIKAEPDRFLRVVPVDAAWSRGVLMQFIAVHADGTIKQELHDAATGPGGLRQARALLQEHRETGAAFARFEAHVLMQRMEAFLKDNGIAASSEAPDIDLFEGLD